MTILISRPSVASHTPIVTESSIKEEALRRWTLGAEVGPFDDGTASAGGWTVWLIREFPGSDMWTVAMSPGPEQRAKGRVEERSGIQFRTDATFDVTRFDTERMDELTVSGHVIPERFKAATKDYLEHLDEWADFRE